jgi:transposase
MPGPYSNDLRKRAIDEVGSGASRREAAEQFGVSPSAVIKWVQRWCDTGSATAKPSGGSVSPLEKYAQWFFDLIAAQPDLTLDEIMVAKKAARIPGSRSAVGRFFRRHDLTVKKKVCTLLSSSERTWRVHAGVGYASKVCSILRG